MFGLGLISLRNWQWFFIACNCPALRQCLLNRRDCYVVVQGALEAFGAAVGHRWEWDSPIVGCRCESAWLIHRPFALLSARTNAIAEHEHAPRACWCAPGYVCRLDSAPSLIVFQWKSIFLLRFFFLRSFFVRLPFHRNPAWLYTAQAVGAWCEQF